MTQNIFKTPRTLAQAQDTAIEMSRNGRPYAVYASTSGGRTLYAWASYKPGMDGFPPEGHSPYAKVTVWGIYREGQRIQ